MAQPFNVKDKAGGESAVDEMFGPYVVDFAMMLMAAGTKVSWVKAIMASLSPSMVKAASALPMLGGWIASRLPKELLGTVIIPSILKQVIGEVSRHLRDHIQKHGGKKAHQLSEAEVAKKLETLDDGVVADAVAKALPKVLKRKQFWISAEGILHIVECPKLVAGRVKPAAGELLTAFEAFAALSKGYCQTMKCCDVEIEKEFTNPANAPKAEAEKDEHAHDHAHAAHGHDDHGHEAQKDGPHNGWLSFTTPAEQKIIFDWLCGIASTTKRMKTVDFLAKHLDKHEVPTLLNAIQSNDPQRLQLALRTIENTNLGVVAEKKFNEFSDGAREGLEYGVGQAEKLRRETEKFARRVSAREIVTGKDANGNDIVVRGVSFSEAVTGQVRPKPMKGFWRTLGRYLAAPFQF